MSNICRAEEGEETLSSTRNEIYEAFEALIEAYNSGGEVSGLVRRLNEALNLVSKAEKHLDGDPAEVTRLSSEAQRISHEVTFESQHVKEKGERRRRLETVVTIGSSLSLSFSGVLMYIFGPKLFWRTWVRLRRNCRVTVKSSHKKKVSSMLLSEAAKAFAFAMILMGAVLASSQLFFVGRVAEPFSELAVLDARMNIADYPKEVVAGESVRLNVYVGNHMGRPVEYIVMVKLGNNETSVNPAQVEPIMKFERVLLDNETWILPINTEMVEAGLNQRIIFELWMYNDLSNKVEYHQRWCQIWFNVTEPV